MDDKALRDLVRDLVEREIQGGGNKAASGAPPSTKRVPLVSRTPPKAPEPRDVALAKRVAEWMGAKPPLPPALGTWRPAGDRAFYLGRTPARLGVGRAGTRVRTQTLIEFWADHAAARDAVWSDVDPEVIAKLGLVPLRSAARDKREYLLRPDLGRRLDEESLKTVREKGVKTPQVQIVAADGLSATALNVNLGRVWPVLTAELQRAGVRLGTPFVIRNGRVASGDEVARAVDADVLCLLVGERPGLKSAESLGAYVTWMRVRDFNESMRSVVSNIHQGGLRPEEGARQVAALCLKALRERRTGVEMRS